MKDLTGGRETAARVCSVRYWTIIGRVLELRREIERIEQDGFEYVAKAQTTDEEDRAQEERIERLEKIKLELDRLFKRNLQ